MPRRPVQQRALATVDAIVEAGFICVARDGLAGTTTRHIAQEAGIGVGSLYEYFRNKDEVYQAMRRRLVDDVVATIRPLIPELMTLDIAAAITTMLQAYGRLLQQRGGRYLQCVRQGITTDGQTDVGPIHQLLQALMMQYVMQHPRYMGLRQLPVMSYIFIHGGMAALTHHLSDPHPTLSYDDLVDGLARMVAHYCDRELQLQTPAAAPTN